MKTRSLAVWMNAKSRCISGLLGYWVPRLLGCWVAGLLGCYDTGVPSNRATEQPSESASNPAQIRSMFAAIAARYDRANTVLSGGIHHLWRRRLVRRAGVR